MIISAANGAGRIISEKNFAVFIDSDNNQTNEGFYVMSNSSYWGGNAVNLLQVKSEGTTINGDLSVGSNVKIYKDGRIWAKKVLIKNVELWPDYVFKKEYPLISIKILEDSIKNYGKLPDFPSAKEIETDGMQVEQIIPLLVKKIEEQSLYIIQLNKEIEELKNFKN